MQLLETLKGSGWIYRTAAEKTEARYSIRVWLRDDGAVFGRGHITGNPRSISLFFGRPVSLLLADGQAVSATVVAGAKESDSAEIYVRGPKVPAARIVAKWPG